jgi:hypothetical protein
MEPNKLEQDIKKKLDARSITPTPMAWDRLDAMLSVAEKKETKKKPIVMWLSMAACFIALLFAGIFYLNRESDNVKNGIDNGTAVSVPEKEAENTTPTVVKEEAVVETVAPAAEAPIAVTTKRGGNKVHYKTVSGQPTPSFDPAPEPLEPQVAVNTPEPVQKPTEVRLSKIKVDAGALLASVDKPSQNNIAQNNTPQKNAVEVTAGPAKKTIDVNAHTLLSSVEGELDQSFRGKVLHSIQKNYTVVKTAVATRNRE